MLRPTRTRPRSFPFPQDKEVLALQQRLDTLREQFYWTLRTVNQASHEAHRNALAARIDDLEADIAALTAKRAMRWRQTATEGKLVRQGER